MVIPSTIIRPLWNCPVLKFNVETSVANASSIIEKVLGGEDYETVQAYVDSLNADKK